jgi:hypothetical protein
MRPPARNAIPVLISVRRRLLSGRPVGLDRARLEAHGVKAGVRQRAIALVILHLAVPSVEFAAQLRNWLRARQMPRG